MANSEVQAAKSKNDQIQDLGSSPSKSAFGFLIITWKILELM